MQREQDFNDRSILIPCDDVAHTHLRKTTHTPSMLCHEWVECGHPTEWSQLASTWLRSSLYCMLHVLAYSSNKRHWIIWVVHLYFTWELNKVYTAMEDPTRYPGIGPSTIQPQHIWWVDSRIRQIEKKLCRKIRKNISWKCKNGERNISVIAEKQ